MKLWQNYDRFEAERMIHASKHCHSKTLHYATELSMRIWRHRKSRSCLSASPVFANFGYRGIQRACLGHGTLTLTALKKRFVAVLLLAQRGLSTAKQERLNSVEPSLHFDRYPCPWGLDYSQFSCAATGVRAMQPESHLQKEAGVHSLNLQCCKALPVSSLD